MSTYVGFTSASLPDMLASQAASRPDDFAAVSDNGELTYSGLEQVARRVAAHLRALGVAPDDCVGLFVEPSLDLMVGVWDILFAGAAYLPLSPEYPEDRLRYMIDDSRCRIILAQDHLADRLADLAPRAAKVVGLGEAAAAPAADTVAAPAPDSLAYVIYTSGSMGKPKGVMIEHRSIASQMRWMHACGHIGPGTTVLQKTPISFDAAQWEILAPALGSRVVMGAPGVYRDPAALITAITRHSVTTLQCVPTLLQALLDTEEFAACTSLRRVFSGGEALSVKLARAVTRELPQASLINLYGPTECTINSTAYLVDPDGLGDGTAAVPIGVPVDNTPCFILDENLAPLGIGETGELYIGGTQLARGYLGRPEQTRERFVASPFVPTERLYRTGDLAYWNPDGTIAFSGRVDNQVKLRGYRIELDEIALAIEEHPWVKRARAIVGADPRTGAQSLVACVELNPKEAALMDQGTHGSHHQSKESRLQVRAQLSNAGLRDADDLASREALRLPGRQETVQQRREVFARKTYRFYDGGSVTRADLAELLGPRPVPDLRRGLDELEIPEFGEILRWFGQFRSNERLLPKYAYASPGALYATQMYLETSGVAGLARGVYYYHPADHALVRICDSDDSSRLLVHFVGKRRAIEPVYKNNVLEVLEMETGHMVGVWQQVLPRHGLAIRPSSFDESARQRLEVPEEDYYLGTFEISLNDGAVPADPTEIYVQAHPNAVEGLPAGHYRFTGDGFDHIADELVLPRHVIAINQQVYERASFGVTAVSRATEPWLQYVHLGTKLHHLQRNALGLGLMSSGYSSKTGHPLPAAQRIDDILSSRGITPGPCYFALGGRITEQQAASEGMHEDTVHMKGPAEMIKDDLARSLPAYMLPNQILIMNQLPLSPNGKVDLKTITVRDALVSAASTAPHIAPTTPTEQWLAQRWGKALNYEPVSANDEFFVMGGNSLVAVTLINEINKELGVWLPLQILFEFPRLNDLARSIDTAAKTPAMSSRLIPLQRAGADRPVFCWPGLGGYPMSLRHLAQDLGTGSPFYGIQAHGLNHGETPYRTIGEMAAADIAEIRRIQPQGPYTLYGYSFGARVAFEAASLLEQAGQQVDALLLVCPGNPKVRQADGERHGRTADYSNPAYLTILYSVFAGQIHGPDLDRCLDTVGDEQSFVSFIHELLPQLDQELIRRITHIVAQTYEFEYSFEELASRHLNAPVTILKATGDDYSFLDQSHGYSTHLPTTVQLDGDHYSVLKEPGVRELATAIRSLGHRASS